MRAFHVPKTVDNDLLVTDHCPGYGTAARFVACALMGDDLDNRALPGVKIDVIMGRNAGFLTAAAALGKTRDDDGPHLLYFPERPVSIGKFLSEVEAVYKKLNRCVIAVSEGMCDADGETWAKKIAQTAEKDPHGNIQLSGTGALADFLSAQVKSGLKIKRVRADTFGYLQRSFAGLQSKVDVDEARRCGRQAVLYAMEHDSGSVAMKRTWQRQEVRRRAVPHGAQERGGAYQVDARRVPEQRRQRRHQGLHGVRDAADGRTAQDRIPRRLPESLIVAESIQAPAVHESRARPGPFFVARASCPCSFFDACLRLA